MSNPILVEVSRGPLIESRHRGAIVVVDAKGKTVLSIGDIDEPVFPRSAVKAIQALPLIETGAADALGLTDQELSLACSSHSGEEGHIETARSMLKKAGLTEDCLECGGHWASQIAVFRKQAKQYDSTPPAICNNCSGKHAGFLCTASHTGVETTGYIKPNHPIQKTIRGVMEDVTGASHGEDVCGTDGCSIPTYAIPLRDLAQGFARMATGESFGAERSKAAKRLLNACMHEPFYMAGSKRFCTDVMSLAPGEVFAKTGAEGVFCGAIPSLGLGIALKCDDGAVRASEAMMAATLAHILPPDHTAQAGLSDRLVKDVKTWNRNSVGTIKADLRSV